MVDLRTQTMTRKQIAEFISNLRGVRAFEDVQADIIDQGDALVSASFLVLSSEPTLGSERVLSLASGELAGVDGGANTTYTLGLADTAVVPGSFGSSGGAGAASFVSVVVDQKGRLTSVGSFGVSTTNISEGGNLYYTDARARAAISAGGALSYDNVTGVVSLPLPGGTATFLRGDGAWSTPTASLGLSSVEVNLGSVPLRNGRFTISGSGMTTGKPVQITQAVGPYTGKGTRADEAEMDQVTVTASVTSATTITAYWSSPRKVRGNIKFNYMIGA